MRALISSGASQRFQYDAANRMVRVKADDNSTVLATYTYGDSNERLVSDEGNYRTYYASEGGTVINEYTEADNSTTPGRFQLFSSVRYSVSIALRLRCSTSLSRDNTEADHWLVVFTSSSRSRALGVLV